MNQMLEAMAQVLFTDWFVDFKLALAKTEYHVPYLAPKLWDLFPSALDDEKKPVGWTLSEIGKKIKAVGNATPSTKEPVSWQNGWLYWATPKNLSKLTLPVLLNIDTNITDARSKRSAPVSCQSVLC